MRRRGGRVPHARPLTLESEVVTHVSNPRRSRVHRPARTGPTGQAARRRFGSLAGWAQRHRWAALLIWVAVLAAVTLVSGAAGSAYKNNFALPGTDSQAATDLFTKHGSAQAGDNVDIVLKDSQGLDGRKAGVEKMLAEVKGLPGVADVRSPYADASAVSRDGTIGYATVTLDGKAEAVPKEDITAIIDTAESAESGGLQVELGGEAVRGAQEKEARPRNSPASWPP